MKQYTQNLLEKTIIEIKIIDFEENDLLIKYSMIISLLGKAFNELRSNVSGYSFQNETEEIQFFKEIKPQIFSLLIYYSNIYKYIMNRPTGSEQVQKDYILKQLDKLKDFFDSNIDFYGYIRAGRTDFDTHYFLREKKNIHLNLDSVYFERDPLFSTGYDLKVAKILANNMLNEYYNDELTMGEQPVAKQIEEVNAPKVKVTWTDSKVALIELIYALHTTGSINNGKSDLKSLTQYFENVFNIELGEVYRPFIEIKGRKGNRVQYLDLLRKNMIARMDETDNR